ncbi:hypothetical protein [Latilactobacillus sakei]|uniref:hypothetical protein n=1 Tax=Latilactobacillus sakei TaxID=1599 RepID=UPI000DC6498A|nr:hypothetical protein [Latilactobacillus sakei]SPS07174.1 hypothetical protein LAS9624_01424 [Latilactobacillus sakei]
MKPQKLKLTDYLIGFAFVLLMVGIATILNDAEIILPEIAALTTGLWIYHEPGWLNQPAKIFWLPSITAIVGFGINRLSLSYSLKIGLLLLIMIVLLCLFRSTLAPSFATGLLPIIVNATKVSFIIAILSFTFILMLVVILRKLNQQHPHHAAINYRVMLVFLGISLLWVLVVSLLDRPQMAAIPPVLVVFFEILQKPMYPGKMAIKQIVALTGAATIGVVAYIFIDSRLLVTLIALPLVWLLLYLLQVRIPAAYAFPLLAVILPQPMFHVLPFVTFLATCYFFGAAFVYQNFIKMQLRN